MSNTAKLFTPIKVGAYDLSHRVVLAPMTRLRTIQPGDIPSPMMADFYGQRASRGGLEIIEGVSISIPARSYLGSASFYHDGQVEGWKAIADAVHAKGGRAVMQLIHGGRQSHVEMTGGVAPLAPSVVPFSGVALTKDGFVPASPHRALEIEEIPGIVEEFRVAAQRALDAGFDGVELHGANGYLVDQFIQDGTNKRTDAYGGPIENRARFLRECIEALISVWGADRVGVRISPSGEWGGISDSDPEATFTYVAKFLDQYGLAYLHVIEPRIKGDSTLHEDHPPVAVRFLRPHFSGPIIAAGGFDRESAIHIVEAGDADLVAFGRHFTSNPDLPYRLKHNVPLAPYVRDAFWGGNEKGYTDFPAVEPAAGLAATA
ncbi:alkene reductase [Nguyenibacter sp. L1]|uniref:alkene reductase n=1 Tax=Nguyenibacter sp. L1 TaxID=3049350 RepID=UPI002B48CAF2|nr:alkene reductase [Nguyenibacter sp. L1]WRH88792.1 alkene reductase [Nguyenibacter sp. L1]